MPVTRRAGYLHRFAYGGLWGCQILMAASAEIKMIIDHRRPCGRIFVFVWYVVAVSAACSGVRPLMNRFRQSRSGIVVGTVTSAGARRFHSV
jgi:hypothetical protein